MVRQKHRLSGRDSLILARLRTAASAGTIKVDPDGTWRNVCLASARPPGFSIADFDFALARLKECGLYIAVDDSAFGQVFFYSNAPGMTIVPPKPRPKHTGKFAMNRYR